MDSTADDTTTHTARRYANSMEVFAAGDPTFIWGEWRAWLKACEQSGKTLPPADFKLTSRASDHD